MSSSLSEERISELESHKNVIIIFVSIRHKKSLYRGISVTQKKVIKDLKARYSKRENDHIKEALAKYRDIFLTVFVDHNKVKAF